MSLSTKYYGIIYLFFEIILNIYITYSMAASETNASNTLIGNL
jgi:hypothetical protein